MQAERSKQIVELLQEALGRPAAERSGILERSCSDLELRAEVESLLSVHEQASAGSIDYTGSSPFAPVVGVVAIPAGQRIGRFTLCSVIGLGGMSVVYEAEQDQPRRRVALKILRTGLLAPELVRRFNQEAEVLGRLQHPGIAQIHEAGTGTALGLPYIVMELVKGEPITKFAELRQLDLRGRIELFTGVCDAVEYAHQKGIIHRDLKPGNIVVSDDGQPKVLDFGAALLRDADSSLATFVTLPGQLVGTLPYMSPEQAGGDRSRVGIGTDVYSLGVVLYQLLTGKLPYDLSGVTLVQAAAAICVTAPERPSTANASIGPGLDSILLTALAKQPERRYPSAAALANDLRGYVAGEAPPRRPRPKRSSVRPVVGCAIAGIVALGLIGWGTWRWSWVSPPDHWEHPIVKAGSPFRPDLNDFLTVDLSEEEKLMRGRIGRLGSSKGRDAHETWRELGAVLELQGRFEEAEQAYRAALRAGFPPGPMGGRGEAMTEDKIAGVVAAQGATDEAERIWSGILARNVQAFLDPRQIARIHVRYGVLLDRLGRREEAIEQIESAIFELEFEPLRNADHLAAARALLQEIHR